MKRSIVTGLAGLAALALAVGCSSPAAESPGSSSPTPSASAEVTDGSDSTPAPEAAPRVMQDMIGEVTVPEEAARIATTAPAFTTAVLLLGGADKLVALEENYGKNEWIKGKYPELADLPVVFASN